MLAWSPILHLNQVPQEHGARNGEGNMSYDDVTVDLSRLEFPHGPSVTICFVFSRPEFAEEMFAKIATADLQRSDRHDIEYGYVLKSKFMEGPIGPVGFEHEQRTYDGKVIGVCFLYMSDETFSLHCGEYVFLAKGVVAFPRMSPGFLKTVQAMVALGYAIDPAMGCMFDREILLLQPRKDTLLGRFVTHSGMQEFMPGLVDESVKAASQPIAEFIQDFVENSQ